MITPKFAVLAIFCIILFSGCGSGKYIIDYAPVEPFDKVSTIHHPLNVQLATFSDKRPLEEKLMTVRSKEVKSDSSDYTYDAEIEGSVAEGISDIVVKHLDYSKVFRSVSHTSITSDSITDSRLDSLHERGVDALIVGDINHFYGYYPIKPGLLILGTAIALPCAILVPLLAINVSAWYWFLEPFPPILPMYLESLPSRNIKYATGLTARMISTSTHKLLWEGSCEESRQFYGKMPAPVIFPNKYICATNSLRQAVNKMVVSLSNADQLLKKEENVPLGQEKENLIGSHTPSNDDMKLEEDIPKGSQYHHGFYLSLAGGVAMGSIKLYANNSTFKTGEISGIGLQTNIKIGCVVSDKENLVLSLDLLIGNYFAPTLLVDDALDNIQTDVAAYEVMYGLGIRKYYMPSNTFLGATVGLGDFTLAITDKTKPGFAVQVEAGKEWIRSRALGKIGVALGLKYLFADNQSINPIYSGKLSAFRFYATCSVTFNNIE